MLNFGVIVFHKGTIPRLWITVLESKRAEEGGEGTSDDRCFLLSMLDDPYSYATRMMILSRTYDSDVI